MRGFIRVAAALCSVALAGLAFAPDLYAAGISSVGPSNIITLLHPIPPYWAPMKQLSDSGSLQPPVFNPALVRPDTMTYSQKMKLMGRDVTVTTVRTVVPAVLGGVKAWRVVDMVSSPMGQGTDTLEIDASTLLPLRRAGKQGPGAVSLRFSPGAIQGTLSSGAMTVPVDVKLSGLTLPDGAGLEVPLATLPFAQGYQTTLGVFDLMGVKSKPMIVKVTGEEKLTVAGGTFDAYRLELTSREDPGSDQTFWITKDSRRLVKSAARLPASMGGGTIVSEMTGK